MATATKLSTCFVSNGLWGVSCGSRQTNVRFLLPSQRLLPASCKMRHRDLSLQRKRRQVKKAVPEQPLPTSGDEASESEDGFRSLSHEVVAAEDVQSRLVNGESVEVEDGIDREIEIQGEDVDEKHLDSQSVTEEIKSLAINVGGEERHSGLQHGDLVGMIRSAEKMNGESVEVEDGIDREIEIQGEDVDEKHLDSQSVTEEIKSVAINVGGEERYSGLQHEDLVGMIRSAEKNILILNEARVHALGDLDKIVSEKDVLRREISALEMRLAENDAKMRIAAQEKIRVELMENQLEKLKNELTQRTATERNLLDLNETPDKIANERDHLLQDRSIHSLSWELSSLRSENESLKDDIEALKQELTIVKNADERIIMLEKERSLLESSLKDLESKLSSSQEEVSELSNLKVERKDLWEKVDSLQGMLDKATKQADKAILVLQQNQELRKKVDKLEESLEEVNIYKLSSERLQQYNELMQQKLKLLEEKLQKSDEEIQTYVELYQDSVQEFQATLNTLKEESKKRALHEPVDDMPWEFWSRLLLIIDGWLLEKKISSNDATMLREMVWKRDRRIRDAYMECKEKTESEAVTTFLKLSSPPKSPGIHVIHIAAEMAPVAKVGGLGDVLTGLSKALQRRGHLVEIILPKYDCMQYYRIANLRALDGEVESYFDGKLHKNKIWVGIVEGLPVYFIEPLHPGKFFWRGQVYGEHDDFKRFSYFSRAALELLLQIGKKPDIIHCHDWQTAFVAPLYWDIYAPKGLNSARICFTCHNFEYQGTAPASELASCGLDVHQLNRPDRMQDNSAHDRVNPLKGALVFSNIVTTVSPTYSQEVLTAEGGKGLHSTLNFHSKKFVGILNGIDTDAWNPATDSFLKVQYTANDLQGKAENKMVLRSNLGLSTADAKQPLVGCITRLVPQKGVHLIRHSIYRTLELGGQFVLLGSSPVPEIQREFEDMANKFQNHAHIRLILKYDESLSHTIYAASDMFIIPSIFEPCGLTQMIAMRYGSIPIVRKTGGLNDSVFDIDDDIVPLRYRNGFTFVTPDEKGVNSALERAFNYCKNNPENWQQLIQKVMSDDYSWTTSAAQYEELYLKSVARARAALRA